MTQHHPLGAVGAVVGVGAGLAAYTFVEPYRFRLVEKEVPLGLAEPVEVLHISDAHLTASTGRRAAFLASLPSRLSRTPDLVLATGDMIENDDGIDPLLDALQGFEARWGKFYVNGSHDYYQARFQTYRKYLGAPDRKKKPPADFARLERGYEKQGWVALTNREEKVDTPLGTVHLAGVDDPYLKRHDTSHLKTVHGDALRIGLMHAPDVVSEFALAGFDLLLAGHTHGGQVRFPLIGALVTNSSLSGELACGLHSVGSSWLHVSPGLGNGTYSPIRFLTRPEATLLRLR